MNISENKRVLALSVAFLAAFGGLSYYGYSRSSDFKAAQASLTEIEDSFAGYGSAEHAPTQENLKALRSALDAVARAHKDLQADMEKYAVACYGDGKVIRPGDFQNEVRQAIARVADLASNAGATVANPAADLGMAQFKNALAMEKDIVCRSFQLKAVERMVSIILEAGAPALEKVFCAPLPEDDARKEAVFPLGFEVAFTAKRSQLPAILNKIVGERDFFYTITGISVLNGTTLPGIDPYTPVDAQPVAPSTGDELAGEGEAAAPAPATSDKRIATRKTGAPEETVRVHLVMQVRFFTPGKVAK